MSGANVVGQLVRWLVALRVPAAEREFVLGDLDEGFAAHSAARGVWRARLWYIGQGFSVLWARWPAVPGAAMRKDGVMTSLGADLRFALRSLRRMPLFSLLVILTLGAGMGATSALFSVVYPVLLAAPPYPAPDRLVMLSERSEEGTSYGIGWLTFDDTRRETNVFTALAAMSYWQPALESGNGMVRLNGQRVSHTFFTVLGVQPALGRAFRPEEDAMATRRVVVLSDGLWRRQFGGDASIVGRTVPISGAEYLVAGVMPPDFQNLLSPEAELWAPLGYDADHGSACRSCRHLRVMGRMRPGITTEVARAQLDAYFATLRQQYPDEYGSVGALVRTLREQVSGDVRPALLGLFSAVGLLLLLACANVANLFLGRSGERHTELAVRLALGAERARLVRLVSLEPIVLAVCGGALGLLGAWAGTRFLLDFLQIPAALATRVSTITPVIIFTLLATSLSALLSGTLPALLALRESALADIRMGTRSRVGATRHRLRHLLVVAEMALAVALLVGAGLQVRSLQQSLQVTTGYRPDGVLTMELGVTGPRYSESGASHRYFAQFLDDARAIPGLQSVAIASQVPLGGNFDSWGIHREDRPGNPAHDPSAQRFSVSWQYLDVMGIPVLRGRGFTAADRAGSTPVVLFNEAAVRDIFQGENPIGKRVRVGGSDSPWREVVGVVGDVRHLSLEREIESQFYMPYEQAVYESGSYGLVARTSGRPTLLAEPLARTARALDPGAIISQVRPMTDVVNATLQARRVASSLVGAFAIIALLLASGGLYGVMSASVIERRREMGLRTALGATPLSVVRLVATRGFSLTLLGGLLGAAGVLAAQRLLRPFLFEVTPGDPATLASVVLMLGAVAMVACMVPAWRAARADPAGVLRE